MSPNAESGPPPPAATSPLKRKRVGKACEYCRRKRLKCTTSQYPCTNCQLYGAECVYSTDSRSKRTDSTARTPLVPLNATPGPGRMPGSVPDPVPDSLSAQPLPTPAHLSVHAPSPASEPACDIVHTSSVSDAHHSPLRRNPDLAPLNSEAIQISQSNETVDELLQLWNPPLDLTGSLYFEGLYAATFPPSPTTTANHLPFESTPSQNPLNQVSPSSSSLRDSKNGGGKVSGIESLAHNNVREPVESILPGLFIRKDAHDSNFIGLASTGATTAFCLREALQSSRGLMGTANLDFLIDSGTHVDEAGIWRNNVMQSDLPEKSVMESAMASYFEHVHPIYPIVDEISFRKSVELLYTTIHAQFDYIDYCRIYLILAIGEMARGKTEYLTSQYEQTPYNYYHRSWSNLQECIATPNVNTVQILLLHVIFYLQCGKGGFAWVLCGFAIRVAQAIGLHRRSPDDFDLYDGEIRLRSQLWWVAYRIDACLSMTQGRPTSVYSSTSDVPLLELIDDTEQPLCTTYAVTRSDYYKWTSKLAQIQHRFCIVINQATSTYARLNELGAIDESLVSWCSQIPIESRPGEEILVPQRLRLLATFLHREYFNMMRSVHWASFTIALANKERALSNSSARITGSEAICLSAARSLIKTLDDASFDDTNSIRKTPLCLQNDYFIAALAVVYRCIFKGPRQISARADLEYLRAGKIHLERQAQRAFLSLSIQNLFQAMLVSAENLVSGRV